MEEQQNDDIMLYLAVIWKKLDDIERKVNSQGPRIAPIAAYTRELENAVEKAARQMR